ncbi:hypothetical protein [Chroococcus sp. FPU101]|uniref:Cas10/Cmr2 second palm domain-containing protein n=1 Tax=Chroococcus sp. FPU101 TaxID=1974212 RepID=UPI001A8C1D14|nr:hypothetical protein [Chroococcus sp. FPU101]GFE68265.1 hypothetical protein CFPU101_08750 [Chroococcus sp. FPU101]
MSKFTVTIIDTTGIQSYIFGSNRLRENIGASHILLQVTGDWLEETLKDLGVPRNQQQEPIENSQLPAELVYAGGGNAMVIFRTKSIAVEFTKKLSKKVLIDAPGINLVVAHTEFEWDTEFLYEIVEKLMQEKMAQNKYSRIPSTPLLGLGVNATCNSTQLPAIGRSDEPKYKMPSGSKTYLVSRETGAKLKSVQKANDILKQKIFNTDVLNKYELAEDFDDFSRTEGESSYLAVVHADGNGMGKRFQEFGEGKCNRDYIKALRQLSKDVHDAGIKALEQITKILAESIKEDEDGNKTVKGKFKIKDNFFPFRPIVYGGDDVTFVCDGRIGLELAALYLEKLQEYSLADEKPLKACAGISIVKTHYPFARSYQLSEALCKEAKRYTKFESKSQKKRPEEKANFVALDWHIASSGLSGSLQEIREREYQVSEGRLNMRPVRLEAHLTDWNIWKHFTKAVQEFNDEQKWSRNKVIALREILRQGSQVTQDFRSVYKLREFPSFISNTDQDLVKKGWLDEVCGYFDAIEAMDFYFTLGDGSNESVSPEN